MTMKIITILVLLFYYASGDKFNFTNYALYRIVPKNIEELTTLHSMIHTNNKDLDFFDEPVNVDGLVSVVTSPGYRKTFDEILKANEIYAEVTIENIQVVIDKERIGKYAHRNVRSMTWDAYYTFEDIYSWLDDVAASNSDVVSLIYGGMSYEGREIKGVKISHGIGRRSIFIEGGIHAREWISYATVNYIINELVYSEDPETQAAARDFDWYIFPCTNPDGYVWTHTDFRLWRKNRKPVGTEFGIDLNRNWNSNWLLKSSSTDPSSNTYAGIGPFSEIEARTLASYIESVADTMEMYLSFHSSGQLLMVPYGNTTDPLDNYYDTIKIGRRAMGSLAVRHGTPYITGNIAEAIYEATGTSVDWVKEKLRIPLTYCYELRDRGQYGHLLPADQILPNSEEVMDSVLALIREGQNAEQVKILRNLQDTDLRYDFWTEPVASAEYVQVMTSPENKLDFQNFLIANNINAEISMNNVQEFVDKQTVKHYTNRNTQSMTWDAYYTLDDIYAWINDLVETYPDVATKVIGGSSFEGREIVGVKISHGEGKSNIFIEGGIHAREWISPVEVEELHEHAYLEQMQAFGASTNPLSEVYAGPGPFSEPETRTMSRYMREIGDKMEMFLTFHSYGQMLLLPFGNTSEPLANYHDAMNIGRRAMGALSVRYGTEYVTGNIVEVLYEATGGTDEWVKEHLDVPLVYCFELRDRFTYGFLLPPEQILPNNEETMDSVLDLIHQGKRIIAISSLSTRLGRAELCTDSFACGTRIWKLCDRYQKPLLAAADNLPTVMLNRFFLYVRKELT
ncbi:hypothetical protein MSG28_006750 [Choristoneura fumiferana]|uniref:Uncharacterized protein n=1 Tax=Choristoneura fumiferana TaxID=7141 RepID=A0ACC0JKY5_CHOFU|nr:hypothetical protein MSG28_006750 [Choristoneura fumiferana]